MITNIRQYNSLLLTTTHRPRRQISKVPIGFIIIKALRRAVTITPLPVPTDGHFRKSPSSGQTMFFANMVNTKGKLDSNSWHSQFIIIESSPKLAHLLLHAFFDQTSNLTNLPTVPIKWDQQVDLIAGHLPAAMERDVRQRRIEAGLLNNQEETQVFYPAY